MSLEYFSLYNPVFIDATVMYKIRSASSIKFLNNFLFMIPAITIGFIW
jgi:hypothetical protein